MNIFNIQFTTKDQAYTERAKHFVIAVGTSAAMKNEWQSFLKAAKKLVEEKCLLDPEVTHTTTCITFANRAAIPFHDILLTEEQFNETNSPFPPTCGDPSFSNALSAVLEVIEKHTKQSPVVVILISDEEDGFPHKELKNLSQDTNWKKIDSFWTVAIGPKLSQGTLAGMAQWLSTESQRKAHFLNPKAYADLVAVFEEMAIRT
jgi:hypothetical protein